MFVIIGAYSLTSLCLQAKINLSGNFHKFGVKMNKKPNVILVLTDDQGYGDLGCHGNQILQTPNIDLFHSESIRLTNYHVGPTCAPTRAGLLTGNYANSTGVWHTIGGRSLLREDEWTIADAMGSAGYKTAIFGKWHLGDEHPYLPQDRGFQKTLIHKGGGISQTPDFWGNDYFDDTYYEDGKQVKFRGYCTDVWFDNAIKFIEENKDNPFLCIITPNAPHSPFNVPKKYSRMYEGKVANDRAHFYGMITNIDENFGKLRQSLQSLELEDNTILIFMTDNGTACGAEVDANGFVTNGYNANMRGVKGWQFEGGHRTPCFIRWKAGRLDQPQDISRLTANIDFMPTILDLCGIDANRHQFHGKSLKPLLYGKDFPQRVVVTDSQRLTKPLKWRLSCVMTDNYRLVNGSQLYDISKDCQQQNDVSSEFPEIVSELRNEYEKWWKLVSSQIDQPIPIAISNKTSTALCCHDWRNQGADTQALEANLHNRDFDDCLCPWNQGHIREALIANGYWEVDVKDNGTYTVELCRWPKESNHKLKDGFEGDDVEWSRELILPESHRLYENGKALDVKEAELVINDKKYNAIVEKDDNSVVFDVHIAKGKGRITTTFTLSDGTKLGAYYVYIQPKS